MATKTKQRKHQPEHRYPEGDLPAGQILGGMFVYGTLRTGEPLANWLPKGIKREVGYVRGTLAYVSSHGTYPVLLGTGNGWVKGEFVPLSMNSKPAQDTAAMERGAGYTVCSRTVHVKRNGRMVATKNVAYCFVWPFAEHGPVIASGDWCNRQPKKVTTIKPKSARPKGLEHLPESWWRDAKPGDVFWPNRRRFTSPTPDPADFDTDDLDNEEWAEIEWDSTVAYGADTEDDTVDAWECTVCGFYDEHDLVCMDCGGDPISGPPQTKEQRRGRA